MDQTTKKLLLSTVVLGLIALFSGVGGVLLLKDNFPELGDVLSESIEASPTVSAEVENFVVTNVVDGDTFDVIVDGEEERVRMIGIDTPELRGSECFSQEAKLQLTSLIENETIELVADPTQDDRDRYGRLLRYVYLEGEDINLEMIGSGFAHEYTYQKVYLHQQEYKAAQATAQLQNRGLWGVCL